MEILVDWILANNEWLFSGLLVAVPTAVGGWLLARSRVHRSQSQRSRDNSVNIQTGENLNVGDTQLISNQAQKSGDYSANIQAASISFHQGLSVSDVRQIAIDVFRANFFEFGGDAY